MFGITELDLSDTNQQRGSTELWTWFVRHKSATWINGLNSNHIRNSSNISKPSQKQERCWREITGFCSISRYSGFHKQCSGPCVCRAVDRVSTDCRPLCRPLCRPPYRPISRSTLPTVNKIRVSLLPNPEYFIWYKKKWTGKYLKGERLQTVVHVFVGLVYCENIYISCVQECHTRSQSSRSTH